MTNCNICKSTDLCKVAEKEPVDYKGQTLYVEIESTRCRECGREYIPKEQILTNDARIRDAKKQYDGLLTSQEIYRARKQLGLTQDQASVVFGGGRNAFSKYERAEVSQSVAMDKLVRICLRHRTVFDELCASSGVDR